MRTKKDMTEILNEARSRFKVETAESAKKDDIVNFFKVAYSDQFNAPDYHNEEEALKRWGWANVGNPNIQDKQFPAWFCKDAKKDVIAGHLGIIPVSIKVKNNSYATVWGRDMIVSPEWRGQGIASLLFDTIMKKVKNSTIFFLLAGLNDYAVSIYKKLGFIHLGYIPLYVRIIRLDAILRKRIRNKNLLNLLNILGNIFLKIVYMPSWRSNTRSKSILVTKIRRFDSSFDVLWRKASLSFPIIVKRDMANLNWRFVDQPYWEYIIFKAVDKKEEELKGYAVLREGKSQGLHTGVVTDFFAQPDDRETLIALINFIIRYFEKRTSVDLIRCDIMNRKFERILRKFGFINIRSNTHFMVANINKNIVDPKFIINRNNWFINYADCDLDLSGSR